MLYYLGNNLLYMSIPYFMWIAYLFVEITRF